MNITSSLLAKATGCQPWDLGNMTLYNLCKEYPDHQNEQAIIAKVWLIGRSYAATIERRRLRGEFEGDSFYTNHVAPEILRSGIDEWLMTLNNYKEVNLDSIGQILTVHHKLTELFYSLTGLEKRSLASKYLHFHFPNLFFIYDTRAVTALGKLDCFTEGEYAQYEKADNEYRRFCNKCVLILDDIYKKHRRKLTPRELDNLLLAVSNERTQL